MFYISNMNIMVRFISLNFYTYYFFLCLNIFTTQKIGNKTVEVPFFIPGASTECQIDLRFKPIIYSKIGYLLEFYR